MQITSEGKRPDYPVKRMSYSLIISVYREKFFSPNLSNRRLGCLQTYSYADFKGFD